MTAFPSEKSRHHTIYVPCVLARTCDVVLTLCHQLRPTERFPAVRGAEVPGFGPISLSRYHNSTHHERKETVLSPIVTLSYIYILYIIYKQEEIEVIHKHGEYFTTGGDAENAFCRLFSHANSYVDHRRGLAIQSTGGPGIVQKVRSLLMIVV
jgi:hypothetical protein